MAEKKIEIIVGTNEEYVLGYKLVTSSNGKRSLEQSFADHSHTGSVRQVAVGGKYLVSGGTDEHIKVFDLEKHVEVGTLMEHSGTVTYLGFHGNRYLFSASEDGKICIFARKGWQCEKTLKNQNSPVVSVSVHPSGKMALSLTQDKKLRTWNLIKGRKAYMSHMDRIADLVKWSPTGSFYVIVKGSCVEVYDVASCKVVHSVDFKERVTVLVFLTEDIIAVAAGDKNVCFYDVTNHFEILQWQAHELRVKSLSLIPRDVAEEPWLVSASSDGIIKLWELQMLDLTSKPKLLAEVDTTCRIICSTVYISGNENKKEKIESIIKKEESESIETVGKKKKSKTLAKINKMKTKANNEKSETKHSAKKKKIKTKANNLESETKPLVKKKKSKTLVKANSESMETEALVENGTEAKTTTMKKRPRKLENGDKVHKKKKLKIKA